MVALVEQLERTWLAIAHRLDESPVADVFTASVDEWSDRRIIGIRADAGRTIAVFSAGLARTALREARTALFGALLTSAGGVRHAVQRGIPHVLGHADSLLGGLALELVPQVVRKSDRCSPHFNH